jgi:hypothetical protein
VAFFVVEGNGNFGSEEFFLLVSGHISHLYQNLLESPSFDTLIMKQVLILSVAFLSGKIYDVKVGYQKGPFLIQPLHGGD